MDRCDTGLHHGLPSDGVSRLMGFCGVFEALIKLSELKELQCRPLVKSAFWSMKMDLTSGVTL